MKIFLESPMHTVRYCATLESRAHRHVTQVTDNVRRVLAQQMGSREIIGSKLTLL
jgi:hypothetical protein